MNSIPYVLLILSSTMLGTCSFEPAHLEYTRKSLPTPAIPLPMKCSSLRSTPDERNWDEERHEYWPPNHEWEKCMGVERKDFREHMYREDL